MFLSFRDEDHEGSALRKKYKKPLAGKKRKRRTGSPSERLSRSDH